MPTWMWYIIGGAITAFVLIFGIVSIMSVLNFRKMKRNFDNMKEDIDRDFDKSFRGRHGRF